MACLAVNCRFCKYERERDGILAVPSTSSSSSIYDEIRSRMSVTTATMDLDDGEGEGERDGTASLHLRPDDTCFDMNALASSLRSRRDSIHSCGDREEGVEMYYTEQLGLLGDGIIDGNVCDDIEMGESEEDNGIEPPCPSSSSVYSNDNPLVPLHSPLYTQSESGVPDKTDNASVDFLDNVLFDLDAWLDAGGLDAGGLHDGKDEEEYAEYVAWYKVVVRGVARGMAERGEGWGRRRSV